MTIPRYLHQIVATKRDEIAILRQRESEDSLADKIAQQSHTHRPFADTLKKDRLHLIAEVKKASPSKGVIRNDFDPVEIALQFERQGASAISVLTDRDYFMGDLAYLSDIRRAVTLPLLRKDFILDPIQILESKLAGADAILLILAILSESDAHSLHEVAIKTGLDVLVEIHTESELERALNIPGIQLIGINNRNLDTFDVSLEISFSLIPENKSELIWVSESGFESDFQLRLARSSGFNAVLIGEGLARIPALVDFFR